MNPLMDYSEIQEAARLLSLLGPGVSAAPVPARPAALPVPNLEPVPAPAPAPVQPSILAPASAPLPPIVTATIASPFRGDRLDHLLAKMCKRGGFSGAVVADYLGFPLGVYNSPVSPENLAAFTCLLGSAIEQAGNVLGRTSVDHLSIDIGLEERAVLRRFTQDSLPYYLLVICSTTIDERNEMDLSLSQIVSLLGSQ
jgi:hypothetical protein